MTLVGAVFEEASQHCDVIERLGAVRPDQAVRGVWFSMLRDEVRRRGASLGERFDREVGPSERITFKMYPVGDYLRHLVVAGALVASPAQVHEGMQDLHRLSVRYFARSLVGRAIVSLVRPTPLGFFQQIARSRPHIATYGRWFIEPLADTALRIRMVDEPVYIESAQLGGVLSTLDVCGVEGTTRLEMHDRFTGTVTVEWRPSSR